MNASRLLVALFAAATLVLTGCPKKETSPIVPKDKDNGDTTHLGSPIGTAPYPAAATVDATPNPVTVPLANLVVLRKVDLSSEVDGLVKFIGVETDEATAKGLNPRDVCPHPREKKIFRRLEPGMIVKRDQVIAILDDEAAYIEWKGTETKAMAAKNSAIEYGKTVEELKLIVEQQKQAARTGAGSLQELYNSRATLSRYQADKVDHDGSADVAAAEEKKAKTALDKRTIRAPVEGEVIQVHKHEGEGVKASEPILTIHEYGKLRAIGNLPKEYVTTVSKGDEVTIEVPRDFPFGATFNQHTTNKPIVAIAVTVVGGKPVIVSAAEDGWVQAWDRDLNFVASWRVEGGVRSIAVTRAGVDPGYALVGGADGIARLYSLSNPDKKPVREFDGRHDGGVTAAAFSPDGRYCVTADERGINMYTVNDGKRKYQFSTREHHSPITSLSFTPQGRVISAGREPSVRVWQVGTEGAKVEHRIDSRSGDIPMLSVTDDGARLLLDADKTHLDIVHLQEMRKERPLVTAGEAARFTTFAAWSPDGKSIATTGGAEGVVQLWRAPTAKARGTEMARFFTYNAAAATCAAFCPQGEKAENGFLVVGTRKGLVHLWPMPKDETQPDLTVTVTHVNQEVDASGRTVNVLVDFNNPKIGDQYLLRPGAAVTLVIRPKQ